MTNLQLFFIVTGWQHRFPLLDNLMVFGATDLILIVISLVVILGFLGRSREKRATVLTVIGILAAYVLIYLIRLFINEPRPFATYPVIPLITESTEGSFPSVHATVISAIAFSFVVCRSRLAWIFLVLMLWVGFARVYVGVHYPLDILGGVLTGFIAILIGWHLEKYLRKNYFPKLLR